jgi:hypothetical protein
MSRNLILLLFMVTQCELHKVDEYCKIEEYYNEDGREKFRCYP